MSECRRVRGIVSPVSRVTASVTCGRPNDGRYFLPRERITLAAGVAASEPRDLGGLARAATAHERRNGLRIDPCASLEGCAYCD